MPKTRSTLIRWENADAPARAFQTADHDYGYVDGSEDMTLGEFAELARGEFRVVKIDADVLVVDQPAHTSLGEETTRRVLYTRDEA